jgi:asparagine synthase (glutamine-hydrolysing)
VKYFVCLTPIMGGSWPEALKCRYELLPRRRALSYRWDRIAFSGSPAAREIVVLSAWTGSSAATSLAAGPTSAAVGSVRLDNRPELEQRLGCRNLQVPDLELVRRLVASEGVDAISRILGDFAFIVWDERKGTLAAATDAFAVRKLFYARWTEGVVFASRAEALALDEGYDPEFFAEQVAGTAVTPGLTPYATVRQVPAGSFLAGVPGRLQQHIYWAPTERLRAQDWTGREAEAVDTCRELVVESVRLRLDNDRPCWAQLSGGLDSASIVSVAQWLARRGDIPRGLEGTITYVDMSNSDADERFYSSAVTDRWDIRNHAIVDTPLWIDGDDLPPLTDWPGGSVAFHPRDRRVLGLLGEAPGAVLTGFAGDELFTGTMYFFADWIAGGRLIPAFREMLRRAAIGRASVWDLAYQNALFPLMPGAARRWLSRVEQRVPPWVTPAAARRFGLGDKVMTNASCAGPYGGKYRHALAAGIQALSHLLEPGYLGDEVELRHPFLYRPLVEFALGLPPELCVRPQARKWVLREAMRGLVPEPVRCRIGKGGVESLLAWSLTAHRKLLEPLTHAPMLAQLGIVDASKLRQAVHLARTRAHGEDFLHIQVQSTLMLEAWLQLRSNGWPPLARANVTAHNRGGVTTGTGGVNEEGIQRATGSRDLRGRAGDESAWTGNGRIRAVQEAG